jgi:hypothetical protein
LKVLNITLTFLFLCSCSDKQNSNQINNKRFYKFYDFNLNVDIINGLSGLESRMLIVNAGDEFDDELSDTVYFVKNSVPDVLYFITYKSSIYNQKQDKYKKTLGDTAIIHLTKSQLDTIYSLASKVFRPQMENISKDSVPTPPSVMDGDIAMVVFDMKFRGDRYSRLFKNMGNEDFQHLQKYLMTIKDSQ